MDTQQNVAVPAGLSAENPLKNAFHPPAIEAWARRLGALDASFDERSFLTVMFDGWQELTFGQRAQRITSTLEQFLPSEFAVAAQLLVAALDPPLGEDDPPALYRFYVWPQASWVAQRGRQTGDFDTTAHALKELTQRFSAEGDLRALFDIDPVRALNTLTQWVREPDVHVRRLVSEGTRPRLPLAARWKLFDDHPQPIFDLLDALKDDPALYVRRSVANNLNDWAKICPDRVAELLVTWAEGAGPERRWLVDHGSRTLVKRGHPLALGLKGVDVEQTWEVRELQVDEASLVRGGVLSFTYQLIHTGTSPAEAVADFFFGPWPGSRHAKVFKGRRVKSSGGQTVVMEGRRSLIDTSGRTWRTGPHRLAIQVNGKILAEVVVTLV